MKRLTITLGLITAALAIPGPPCVAQYAATESASDPTARGEAEEGASILRPTLREALDLALVKNRRTEASKAAIDVARAQIKQARSARWPEISSNVSATRMDEPLDFIFPASSVRVPSMTIPVPSMSIVIPANAFGPGFPPVDVPLATPPGSISVPASTLPVPEQKVKLLNRDTLLATIKVTYPLYTGGIRPAKLAQAEAGMEVARQESRKTDQEIVFDTTRAYLGVVLSRRLVEIAKDSLARMEATLEMTERMYTTGSGRVKKTDFLRNKSAVETLRSAVALLVEREERARAALAIALGLEWNAEVDPAETEIPFSDRVPAAASMVPVALDRSPDLARVRAAISASEASVREAKSGHLPKVALFGEVGRIVNSYDAGIVSPENKSFWTVGLGVQIPIFEGFRTVGRIGEAESSLRKLRTQHALLEDAKALEVEEACFAVERARDQEKAAREGMRAAVENRDLNARAYQDELVETKDVIESQLLAAWLTAQYELVRYDHAEAQARLDLAVGAPVR